MKSVFIASIIAVLGLAAACTSGGTGARRGGGDGGTGTTCSATDQDGDGIPDSTETAADTDGDGTINPLDDDSDGDGISDADERGNPADPCGAADTDGDGVPDFLDTDSDNDGLTDDEEVGIGTNPRLQDSDGDGIPDVVEIRGSRTDPTDPASTIPTDDFFVVLPYLGPEERRTLSFGTDIEVADVFFLVDMTGSMGQERTNLINGVVNVIVPGIQERIRSVYFGAGGFDDYPYMNYGTESSTYHDLPFYLLQEVSPPDRDQGAWSITASADVCPSNAATSDIGMFVGGPNGTPDILEAVQGLPCHAGNDVAESHVPALYATASGEGLSWPGGMVPAQSCPSIPDSPGMRRGYPCFRPGALPIILLFGDNPFHNGPGGSAPYANGSGFMPPTYDDARARLTGIGARVMGIYSGSGGGRGDYEAIARDTGAVRADGSPLVFNISSDGSGLTTAVVDAVAELVGGTPQSVSTRTENVPGNPDDFNAPDFIKAITPIEGYQDGVPGTGYSSKDDTTFYDVIPGTQVEFEVLFWNDVRMPASVSEVFVAKIIVVGNGVADLDSRNVYILVPRDGSGPILI